MHWLRGLDQFFSHSTLERTTWSNVLLWAGKSKSLRSFIPRFTYSYSILFLFCSISFFSYCHLSFKYWLIPACDICFRLTSVKACTVFHSPNHSLQCTTSLRASLDCIYERVKVYVCGYEECWVCYLLLACGRCTSLHNISLIWITLRIMLRSFSVSTGRMFGLI